VKYADESRKPKIAQAMPGGSLTRSGSGAFPPSVRAAPRNGASLLSCLCPRSCEPQLALVSAKPPLEEAQKQLVEFLRTDLELAQIFVDSARQQLRMGQFKDHEGLLSQAAKAINTIRYFGETISDQHIRVEIQNKLEQLENHLLLDGG
jgi:hypothetical protein